jgi:hypothetical protein
MTDPIENGRDNAKRSHDRLAAFVTQINEASVKSGETAIRSALLMNGGAAVSVLAFLGGLASRDFLTAKQLGDISSSLIWFATGVAVAGAALAFSYFTNFTQVRIENSRLLVWEHPYVTDGPETKKWQRYNLICHWLAVVTGVLALIILHPRHDRRAQFDRSAGAVNTKAARGRLMCQRLHAIARGYPAMPAES